FKRYNDHHGHQGGDRLLKGAAAAWQARMRRTDLLARYGGEEFAVLLRDCTPMQAVMILDDLRAVNPDGQTFSAGIAEWDGQEGPERLVGRADRALYEAKHAGRDRINVAPSRLGHHPDTQATSPIKPETASPPTQIDTKEH
ncbi:MAG: diguanylate cyclase, partial [Actinomycetia bacterium]|nr:diguanylate cyclase [Actinomycetes bacterium]